MPQTLASLSSPSAPSDPAISAPAAPITPETLQQMQAPPSNAGPEPGPQTHASDIGGFVPGPDDAAPPRQFLGQPIGQSLAADSAGQPTPTQPQIPAWAARLQQAGIDTSGFRSEEDLVNAYLQAQSRVSEIEPYAQYGQQFLPYAQQFSQFLRSQQQPVAPQPAEPPATKKSLDDTLKEHWNSLWNRPSYDPSWEAMVKLNPDTGFYEGISPYVPAEVVQGMNSYRDWQRKAVNDLLQNPFELNWKAMLPGIQEEARRIFQEELTSYTVGRDFESLESQYENVLYEHDASGQRMVDPFTGQYRFTKFGEYVVSEMHALQQAGITDPYKNFEYAVNSAKARLYDQRAQSPSPAPLGLAPPQSATSTAPAAPHTQAYPLDLSQQAPAGTPGPLPAGAVPSMHGGYFIPQQYGANGQIATGGGFVPGAQPLTSPQQSFLDRSRAVQPPSTPYAGQPASPSGPQEAFDSEHFFTNQAIRLGLLANAA